MKRLAIRILVFLTNLLYDLFKIFPSRNKITLISRQSDEMTLDFKLLSEQLNKMSDAKIVVLTRTLDINVRGLLGYLGHILRQMFNMATSRVVVLDGYCIIASILKHKKSLTIIQTWHATAAIKQFGHQTIGKEDGNPRIVADEMKMHQNYDYVICASKETEKAFAKGFNVSMDKFVPMALPRLDYMQRPAGDELKAITDKYPELLDKSKKNIVYIPTFRKDRPVDVASLAAYIDYSKYNLIVKPHSLDVGTCKLVEKLRLPNVICDQNLNTYDLIKLADCMISDYSSFIIEASILDIPIYMYVFDLEEYKEKVGINVDMSQEAIGKYQFVKAKDVAKAIEENNYDMESLHQFRDKYIEVETKDACQRLAAFVIDKLNK
ncbi:MAG: CDP-glycerol glycerophosphotransferase family protein [Clostridia bacterium]|nr:CDP-glycerol glycerophosphotransferase family protein [Clostridia bacterium]